MALDPSAPFDPAHEEAVYELYAPGNHDAALLIPPSRDQNPDRAGLTGLGSLEGVR